MECVEFRTSAHGSLKKHSDVDAWNWNSGTSSPERTHQPRFQPHTNKIKRTVFFLNIFAKRIFLLFLDKKKISLKAGIYRTAWWIAKCWMESPASLKLDWHVPNLKKCVGNSRVRFRSSAMHSEFKCVRSLKIEFQNTLKVKILGKQN